MSGNLEVSIERALDGVSGVCSNMKAKDELSVQEIMMYSELGPMETRLGKIAPQCHRSRGSSRDHQS